MHMHSTIRHGWRNASLALLLGMSVAHLALAQTVTPDLSLGNASVSEGNTGITTLNVPLTRTGDSNVNIGVEYRTYDGGSPQATAGTDYQDFASRFGVLAAGSNTLNLPVSVNGDTTFEPDEQFLVHLLSATNAGPTPAFDPQTTFGTGAFPQFVTVGDLNGDGRPDLVVANSSVNSISVLLNTTAPGTTSASFAPRSDFGTGSSPESVTVGDFNGDGRPDLAVANRLSNNVSVLLNATLAGGTTASFVPQAAIATGARPRSITQVDVNGDGLPDLVVANANSNNVSVLLNTTAAGAVSASFAPPTDFGTGVQPISVAVGDLNADGLPDLVVTNGTSNSVSVLLNTTAPGAASASFAPRSDFATGTAPQSVAIGDVNGDGRPDLAIANAAGNSVSVLLNTTEPGAASASFAPRTDFATGAGSSSVTLGDLNGDGRPDLAVANSNSSSVSVLLNTTAPGAASASFGLRTDIGTGANPGSVAVGDLNGDSRPDLAVANYGSSSVSVLLNTTVAGAASADYAPPSNFGVGSGPSSVAIGDVNGDGRPDIAVANFFDSTVSVLLNTTPPGAAPASYAPAGSFGVGSFPISVAIGDVNGDGRPDLAVANFVTNNVSVLLNTTASGATTASYAPASSFGVGNFPYSVAIGDLNGDGRPDLAVVNQGSNTVSVLLNTTAPGAATASYTAANSFGVGSGPVSVAIGDVNGDGRPDLAVANQGSNNVSVLLNTTAPGVTTASYAPASSFIVGSQPLSVAIGDLNGDGRPDLAVVNLDGSNVSVLLNTTAPGTATPSYAPASNFGVGVSPVSVALGDLNGDGRPDLAVANLSSANVSVLLNTTAPGAATASYAAASSLGVGNGPRSVALGDLNGDGRPDLAVANQNSNTVSVLLNRLYPVTVSDNEAVATILNDDVAPDTTPDAFLFTDQTDVARNVIITSNAVTITGIDTPSPLSVTGGEYSIGCTATFTATAGTLSNNQTVCVRHTSSSQFGTAVNTVLTVGGVTDTFTSTTRAADTTPDDFSFASNTNVERNSYQQSAAIKLSGLEPGVLVPFQVTNGFASINGEPCTRVNNPVVNGDFVALCHTASANFNTDTVTTVTVGTYTTTFTSTTLAQDVTPDAFSFTAVSDVALNTLQTSNSITVSGINAPSPVSVSGGLFGIGAGPCTNTSGTVSNGDTIRVCHTASGNYATATQTTLTIGAAAPLTGVSAIFQSTTMAAPVAGDTTPDAFSFTPVTNAVLSSVQTSNTITVSGINAASPISITGGSYRIGSGAFVTTAGTVTNGQTVTVRLTASASPVSRTTATLSIGGVSAAYIVVTKGSGSNCTPDPFTFAPPVKPAALSTVYTSNTVTITGISQAGCKLSVSNGSYSLNGSPFTTTAITTVINGDTVTLQTTSSSSYDKTISATFKMGGTSRSFDVTTGKKPK